MTFPSPLPHLLLPPPPPRLPHPPPQKSCSLHPNESCHQLQSSAGVGSQRGPSPDRKTGGDVSRRRTEYDVASLNPQRNQQKRELLVSESSTPGSDLTNVVNASVRWSRWHQHQQ